jgi:DNA polymerase-3 subunit delta'
VFILDGAETMRWDYANIFLKILEEPPETSTLILIAPNPYLLLPTIRSRCLHFFFAPLPAEQIERFLKQHTKLRARELKLAAQLSGGSPGVALVLDLAESLRLRRQALHLLELALPGRALREVFEQTAELAKSEKGSFDYLLEVLYTLLIDLLHLSQGPKKCILRNPDLRGELEALSEKANLEWVAWTVGALDQLYGRLRRNINRQLALDALAVSSGSHAGRLESGPGQD